jgi:hypothetical protein
MVEETETTSVVTAASGDDKKETTGKKMRRAKSFCQRIRGFFTSESHKERRARKEAEAAKKGIIAMSGTAALDASAMTSMDTDESTGKGVQVDDRSTSTKCLVLLLMDPETRRFELLRIEFINPSKALVADVLAKIPLCKMEEALRQQVYTGVMSRDGKKKTPETLLSDFCIGNDVLAAVSESVPAKECARLAKPILSDDKVISVVRYTVVIFDRLSRFRLDVFLDQCDSPTDCILLFYFIFSLRPSGTARQVCWTRRASQSESGFRGCNS